MIRSCVQYKFISLDKITINIIINLSCLIAKESLFPLNFGLIAAENSVVAIYSIESAMSPPSMVRE